jgi:VanZ family protein
MAARSETGDMAETAAGARWRSRAWRYGPVAAALAFIFYASTGAMAASNTSRIIGPLVRWLFPDIGEASLVAVHMVVRKCAHFTEYAALALLAARAFLGSSQDFLRRRWLVAAFALVACVALADEFNQSFYDSRTGTIRDSLLDCAGGATALVVLRLWRGRKRRRPSERARPGKADRLIKHEVRAE